MAPVAGSGDDGTSAVGIERLAPVTYLFGAQPRTEQYVPEPEAELEPDVAPVRGERERRPSKGEFDRVSNVSMYALARRGMSSREMRDYLRSRDFEAEIVDDEITRLEGVGLLDDESLAETLVRTLRERKGLGKQALTAELRRRHLDVVAIEEAMSSVGDDELERAIAMAQKRAPQLRSLDAETAKRRLGAFLMRKGYSGSVVSTAVSRALAGTGPTFR